MAAPGGAAEPRGAGAGRDATVTAPSTGTGAAEAAAGSSGVGGPCWDCGASTGVLVSGGEGVAGVAGGAPAPAPVGVGVIGAAPGWFIMGAFTGVVGAEGAEMARSCRGGCCSGAI